MQGSSLVGTFWRPPWGRKETPRNIHMVTTRNMTSNRNAQEEASQPDPMALILKIQKEMEFLKKKSEEEIRGIKRRSEEEMETLRKENAQMKQKLVEKSDIPEAVGDIPRVITQIRTYLRSKVHIKKISGRPQLMP